MRHHCAEAVIYGDKSQPAHLPFGKVIVILNPIADKKSATDTVGIFNLWRYNALIITQFTDGVISIFPTV